MQTFISRLLTLLPPSVVLSLLVCVRPAMAVYHYKKEWVVPLYLLTFKLFGIIIVVLIVLAFLCCRKSPLVKAIENEDIYNLGDMIRKKPKLLNAIISTDLGVKTTPLIYAIDVVNIYEKNDSAIAIAKLLINRGADVNKADDRGWSPLLVASAKGLESIVQLLLNKGANPSYVSPRREYGRYSGQTPLDAARFARHDKIVEILMNGLRTNK